MRVDTRSKHKSKQDPNTAFKRTLFIRTKLKLQDCHANIPPSTGQENSIAQPSTISYLAFHLIFRRFSPFNCCPFKPGADTSCPFCPHETEDELRVLCKCTTYNNIRPDCLRRDGLRSGVPYHSVRETTNQCRLQQIALFHINAGKMRQITD